MAGENVGYRNPPRHSRFQKGRSGNPKGRPRGTRNFKTDLIEELQEKLVVTDNGKRRVLTRQQAVIKRLLASALQGEPRFMGLLLQTLVQLDRSGELISTADFSSDEDRRILERFLARNRIREDGR
jgi:hypothetical protein